MTFQQLHRSSFISGGAADRKVRFFRNNGRDPAPNEFGVIDNEGRYRAFGVARRRAVPLGACSQIDATPAISAKEVHIFLAGKREL